MPDNKITTTIKCHNIAPLENLDKTFKSSSLKIAIFANNGSGKTFISRLFRLTEKSECSSLSMDEEGNSPTDKLLTLGKNHGLFSIEIEDKNKIKKESFCINFVQKEIPVIPNTNYIYHTFNQDYVENNIKALSFEKDSEIEGYILGKANIDLKEDEDKLSSIEQEIESVVEKITQTISDFLSPQINKITNIKRLNEYKNLNTEYFINHFNEGMIDVSDSLDILLTDYSKIKAVPENLDDIETNSELRIDLYLLKQIQKDCEQSFTLSKFSEEFKQELKTKSDFISNGIKLLNVKDEICPFCGQTLKDDALNLIDQYTQFLEDTEAKTIRTLKEYKQKIRDIIKNITELENRNNRIINRYNVYKEKYIPYCKNTNLEELEINNLLNIFNKILESIDSKINDISRIVDISNLLAPIEKEIDLINEIIINNNKSVKQINLKKDNINDENKRIRKEILKAAYNKLLTENDKELKLINQLQTSLKELKFQIQDKSNRIKSRKKDRVAATIKKILNYFFRDKYTLDENTFQLIFRSKTLCRKKANEILSEGERNIIAFAYYLGALHLKMQSESDYDKLFFIIDDPISSMDFTHVYTVCGVIRDLKNIIKEITKERFIILTHNVDFMRVLSSNNIVDKKLLLKKGELKDFNTNSTVPYIYHLLDIYRIARCGEQPTHTTANSIRHIIETLTKFENIEVSSDSIAEYIHRNIKEDTKSYTLINDLSHGAWRGEQSPITDDDFKDICETIIKHIEQKYKGQVDFCKKIVQKE